MSDSFEFALKLDSGHESLYFEIHKTNSSSIPHGVVDDMHTQNYSSNSSLLVEQLLELSAVTEANVAAKALQMGEYLRR
jgi:hypothetical protein